MTPYLQAVWNRLVRRYRLKVDHEDSGVRVLSRALELEKIGGPKRCAETLRRYLLSHHKDAGYIEFQEQIVTRRFRGGRKTSETIQEIAQHFTVNGSGSIRRLYRHDGTRLSAVRSISLRNYYQIADERAAQLIMANGPKLQWLLGVPVAVLRGEDQAGERDDTGSAPERWLNQTEMAKHLGVHATTVRRWRLPCQMLGRLPRYRVSEVEAHMKTAAFRRRLQQLKHECRGRPSET